MELRRWLQAFKDLHERARKGTLNATEREKYLEQREELARAVVAGQQLTTLPGHTARQMMRVAKALQIDLDLNEGRQRFMTMHISAGGFGTLMVKPPTQGQAVGFVLKIPGATEPMVGRVKMLDAQKRTGNFLVSFAFEDLTPEGLEQLEMVLFDSVLQQFQGV